MGDKEHHVHFSGSSGVGYNNIVIQPQRHGILEVHLGFLQENHRYHVEFSVPWNPCNRADLSAHAEGPAIIGTSTADPNCQVVQRTLEKESLRLKLELFVDKEHALKEEILLQCCKDGPPLKLILDARVLGKGQGTPLLRNGIHNIGNEPKNKDSD